MAFLPSHPLKLTGGCMCTSIRYTISIPPRDERPILEGAVTHHHGKELDVPTRFPTFSLDYCASCRVSCGGLVLGWMIMPQSWIAFHMGADEDSPRKDYATEDVIMPTEEVLNNTTIKVYNSSDDVHRTFCGTCGTSLTFAFDGNEELPGGPMLDLTMGSLDQESLMTDGVRVDRHGWWSAAVPWVRDLCRNGDEGIVVTEAGIMSDVVEDV